MRTKTENIMQYVPTGETYTVDLFEFHELADDVRADLVDRFMVENEGFFDDTFRDCHELDIWEAVKALQKQTGCKWFYNPWYSCDFDVNYKMYETYETELFYPADDNGYYASFDICEAWNAHIRKMNALHMQAEYLYYLENDVYPIYNAHYTPIKENIAFNTRVSKMIEAIYDEWTAELERACVDVANTIQSLLDDEWNYVHSHEYAQDYLAEVDAGYECRTIDNSGRVYYHDTRKWYTADGQLYEEASVDHACISIVKAG